MPRHSVSEIDQGHKRRMINDVLFQVEPELKLLQGLVATLQLLGEASDAVDPLDFGHARELQPAFDGSL